MVSRGDRPSVISALMKYQTTERMRQAVNDAFDVHGGRAICDGPSNYLQSAYQMVPVGITVEGANILTRTLITVAQGALRSHPYLYKEIRAAQDADPERGLDAFEEAFSGHVAFSVANATGAFFHNITGGRFAPAPEGAYEMAQWYRQLGRAARSFAFVADLTVATLGGGLKTKQKISGRLADAPSELYFVACVLKRYEDDGRISSDRTLVSLCAANGLYRYQEAMRGVIENFPNVPARVLMRVIVFPFGAPYRPASDAVGHRAVRLVLEAPEVRDRLTRHIYVSRNVDDPTGLLEVTMKKVVAAEEAEKKLDRAIRAGTLRRYHGIDWIGEAMAKGIVTESEGQQLREVEALVARVIAVDHFDPADVKPHYQGAGHNSRGAESAAAE
jgi:acyl-CoA dehydrogenase